MVDAAGDDRGAMQAGIAPAISGRREFLGTAGWGLMLPAIAGAMIGTGSPGVSELLGAGEAQAGTPHVTRPPLPPRFPSVSQADLHEWAIFRRRFIDADGRVVDTGNNCVSHTEGQGWGMLFAVTFDDRQTFERIWNWTRLHLARNEDALHSWCYDPSRPNPVSDPNNATDGDVFIAWALWKASFRWQVPGYADHARAIAADVLNLLVVDAGARTLLLPGIVGFETTKGFDVNLSYYCFPALRDLAEAVPSPKWSRVRDSGLALIEAGRFGRWRLPPDWLTVARNDGTLSPAAGWPARFSYDAIRIPLYLHWARQASPEVQQAFNSYWSQTAPVTPAWVDLRDGVTSSYPSPPGMIAVAEVATSNQNAPGVAAIPSIHASPDYYSSALILLSRLASYENET